VRALVVEDDAHSRDILVELLRRVGCAVEMAENGLDGLRAASRGGHDIVFTDIRMPVLDGMQMLQRLREQPGAAPLPVVAVSASSLEHERRHYIDLGFSDFVGKPYAFEEILRMLALHAGARFEPIDHAATAPATDPPTTDAAPKPRIGPACAALLATLCEAADQGALKPIRQALAQLSAQAGTPDALPPDTLDALHAAAADYDFDRLQQQARALSAEEMPL
jgi:CheY-like chemotaxis protein